MKENKVLISLCHGPAAFLAAAIDEKPEDYLFKGFDMEVFPDALDEGANQDIGYMPGCLRWLLAAASKSLGSISSIPTLQGRPCGPQCNHR